MSQEAVERVLGRMITDEQFRGAVAEGLEGPCRREGYVLSAEELHLLSGLEVAPLARLGSRLAPGLSRAPGLPFKPLPLILGTLLLLALPGCTVSNKPSAQLSQGQVAPQKAIVSAGLFQQFTAGGTLTGQVAWTVVPATGGTISATGVFQAGSTPGDFQVVAVWNGNASEWAGATVTVVPAPAAAVIDPLVVQASGGSQASPAGTMTNHSVAGEAVPAFTSANGTGAVQVRHGFDPN